MGCLLIIVIVSAILRYNTIFTPVKLQAQIHLPFKASASLIEITASNTQKIEEISVFSSGENDPVLRVSLSPDGCCVFAIHKSGALIKWDMANHALISNYMLGNTHFRGTNFSADGSRLVTPREVLNGGKMLGANVWDTASGKLVFCEGNPDDCPNGQYWDEQKGFFLDPTGEWLFGYHLSNLEYVSYQMSNIDIQNITNHSIDFTGSGYLLLGDQYSHDSNAVIVLMSADINTKYLAYALADGMVRVETVKHPLTLENYGYSFDYGEGYQKQRVDVIDLAIDDTRTWLAELRSDELLVWNLQRGFLFPLVLRVPISQGTALAFDHTGQTLTVSTDSEIRFYDLNWPNLAGSIPVKNTTTLTFSRDNRMLISGDSAGAIHIWGIPK